MNLLIVGKNSYIGRYITEYVASRGAQVRSLGSMDCNFLERDAVCRFFSSLGTNPYTVVFLAVVNKSTDNSFQAFSQNITMIRNLIDGHKHAKIESIVYFSSVDVYGRRPDLPITEQSRIDPDTWYGLAKYACEWMLASSGEVHCPVTILRIPGIFGCSPGDPSVIGRMVQSIRNEQQVILQGNGQVLRDYVNIDDLCGLLWRLIPLQYHGAINVATGESRSILEIAQLVGHVLKRDFEICREDHDWARDFDMRFDTQLLKSLCPTFNFSEMASGIRSYV